MTQKSITKIPGRIAEELTPEQLTKKLHSFEGRIAQFLTNFSGTMSFVYVHTVWFTFWILANQGFFLPHIKPFDPFPYGLLTMVVSLEAIFLATFVLINQNRQALVDEFRELTEEKEQEEEEKEQEELEEEFEDIQKDLEDIKSAMKFIQEKISSIEHSPSQSGNGGGK